MTLQTDLQEAVARVQTDSQLLHTIIHGDDQTDVLTENGLVGSLAKLLMEAETRINSDADSILSQSLVAAEMAEQFATGASNEADRAEQAANDGLAETLEVLDLVQSSGSETLAQAEATLQAILAKFLAVGLPDSLVGAAGQLLKVKSDESGYTLVNSAASPRFYGFSMSGDGAELQLTEGQDDYISDQFSAWMISEGVSFSIEKNALVMTI